MFPMVTMWDDHESANDSWEGGAENHQPEKEGAGRRARRRRCAPTANGCRSRTNAWESYEIGDLATLFRPETRLTGAQPAARLSRELLRDQADRRGGAGRASATGRGRIRRGRMLGAEQEAWLADGLGARSARGTKWQVLAQQVIMGTLALPPEAAGWLAPDATRGCARAASPIGVAASGSACRSTSTPGTAIRRRGERLLRSALDADANLVVLSGDSHNAWAFDLDLAARRPESSSPGTSVTSPGYEKLSAAASRRPSSRARHARPQPAAQMGRTQPARLC